MRKKSLSDHSREAFINARLSHLDNMRETIAKSWLRSRSKNAPLCHPLPNRPASAAMAGVRSVNNRPELFNYIFFQAETIRSENDCSDLCLVIADALGNIVRLAGSSDQLSRLRQIGLSESASLSEDVAGTNAIGTCLYTRKPVYVAGEEHYNDIFHSYISYGAPIFDEHNEIVAVIGAFSSRPQAEPIWLTLLNLVAGNISRECLIFHQRHDLQDLKATTDRLLNTINYGVVVLDEETRIVKANSVARYFLLMYEYELIGQPISTFVSPQDIDFALLENDVYSQEITIQSGDVKRFTFKASVYLTYTWSGKKNYLLVFDREHTAADNAAPTNTAKWHFNDLVGTSPVFSEAVRFARMASKTNCTVLLTGEQGVGKHMMAEAIHNASNFADGPFITVNCGTIPNGLEESELFGYESEAAPGVTGDITPGKFEQANGGTIFLDRVSEMSLEMQMCLLRFFREHTITRVGGRTPVRLNVRVIASTGKNLEEAINNGVFRTDLYYQLNTFNVHLPPLRERNGDVGNLAHVFLQKYKIRSSQVFVGFTPEALIALQNYSWPGNVRELEETIEHAVAIGRSERVRLDDLPETIRGCYRPAGMADTPAIPTLAERAPAFSIDPKQAEREIIIRSLRNTAGNVTRAAELIGISRRTLYRKMEKYNIQN